MRVRDANPSASPDDLVSVRMERTRQHKYEKSEKGRASARERQRRYQQTHITVRAQGLRFTYPIPDGQRKDDLKERLAGFKEAQRTDYKEAVSGWVNTSVS